MKPSNIAAAKAMVGLWFGLKTCTAGMRRVLKKRVRRANRRMRQETE
jgi:hypothetical protein